MTYRILVNGLGRFCIQRKRWYGWEWFTYSGFSNWVARNCGKKYFDSAKAAEKQIAALQFVHVKTMRVAWREHGTR